MFFWIHFYNQPIAWGGTDPPAVSILVFLDSLLQRYLRGREDAVEQVSILVFLDSLLQHCESNDEALEILVSILVFLDSLLQLESSAANTGATDMFQSLFFWIHFYNEQQPSLVV